MPNESIGLFIVEDSEQCDYNERTRDLVVILWCFKLSKL